MKTKFRTILAMLLVALAAFVGASCAETSGQGSSQESASSSEAESESVSLPEETETFTLTVVGGTGSGTYEKGTEVTVTADQPESKRFVCWKKDGETVAETETWSVVVDGNITLTAEFVDTVVLTVVGGTGSGTYDKGSTVEITPVVEEGKYFVCWTIGGETVADYAVYSLTLDGDVTVNAVFGNVYTVTVEGGAGSGAYREGEAVTAVANVPEGKYFIRWTVNGEEISREATYAFNAAATVTLVAELGDLTLFTDVYTKNEQFASGSPAFAYAENGDFIVTDRGSLVAKGQGAYAYTEISFVMYGMDNYGNAGGNFRVRVGDDGESGWMFYYAAHYGFAGLYVYDGEWNVEGTPSFRPSASEHTRVRLVFGDGMVSLYYSVMAEDGTFGEETLLRTLTDKKVVRPFQISSYASHVRLAAFTTKYYAVAATVAVEGGTGSGTYPVGASVTVSAQAPEGKAFRCWKNGETVLSTEKTFVYTVVGDATISAEYVDGVNLTVEGGEGSGCYEIGASVTVVAPEKSGYAFKGWKKGEEIVSTDAEYTFVLTEETVLVAVYQSTSVIRKQITSQSDFTADSPTLVMENDAFKISDSGIQIYRLAVTRDVCEISFVLYGMDNYGNPSGNFRIRLGGDGEGGWMFYYSPFYGFAGLYTYDGEFNTDSSLNFKPSSTGYTKIRIAITDTSVSLYYSVKGEDGAYGAETLHRTLSVQKKILPVTISSNASCVRMASFEIGYYPSATVSKLITAQGDFTSDSAQITKEANGDIRISNAGLQVFTVNETLALTEISFVLYGMDNYGNAGGNFRVRLGGDGEGGWMFYYAAHYGFAGLYTYDGEFSTDPSLNFTPSKTGTKIRIAITDTSVSLYYSMKNADGTYGAETLLRTINVAKKNLPIQISSYASCVVIADFTETYRED